jgi:AbrB family looped-hinge helix DNA binding protein
MRTTIDSAGRLVIPKPLRREAGLAAGVELEIHLRDGRIEIGLAPLPVRLVKRGRFTVAVPQRRLPMLRPEVVEETRRKIRDERARKA